MRTGERESRSTVIERRRCPGSRAVAYRAILRESGRNMIWIGCAIKAAQMARHTGGRQGRILTICMARRALLTRMRTGEREARCVVIESRRRPGSCLVAH